MNKLWRIGNRLSKIGGVPRKISRILELINHLICACSVSVDAEIGERTIFYHRGIGCVVHPKAVIGKECKTDILSKKSSLQVKDGYNISGTIKQNKQLKVLRRHF